MRSWTLIPIACRLKRKKNLEKQLMSSLKLLCTGDNVIVNLFEVKKNAYHYEK